MTTGGKSSKSSKSSKSTLMVFNAFRHGTLTERVSIPSS